MPGLERFSGAKHIDVARYNGRPSIQNLIDLHEAREKAKAATTNIDREKELLKRKQEEIQRQKRQLYQIRLSLQRHLQKH